MSYKQILTAAGFAIMALATSSAVHAAPVYGTSAAGELTGSRDAGAGGGLTAYNAWNPSFTVAWDITNLGSGNWNYKYTFTGLNKKDISHFTLDLSDDCISLGDTDCVTNITPTPPSNSIEFGDKDGITGAIKFDYGGGEGISYAFDSNRAPVYGHLAVKDGGGSATCANAPGGVGNTQIACNNGLLAASDTENITDYVARPNGVSQIPVPAAVWLFGSGLLGLAGIARRKS